MSRSTLALAVGLVCCVLFASAPGAAAVAGGSVDTAGQLDDDSTVDDTTSETTNNTTETVSEPTTETAETTNTTSETTTDTAETTEMTNDTTETVSEPTTETASNTTGTVSETADDTTSETSDTTETADTTTDIAETADNTTETVSDPADSTDVVSDTAGTTTESVGNTTVEGRAGTQDVVNRSQVAGEPTPGSGPPERATPGRDSAGANAASAAPTEANATAAGGTLRGPGGPVPSPDGQTAVVGVGAAVAAGAAGRAYVGSTGGSPQTVTGLARTGAPMVRTLPRALLDRTWRYLGAAGYVLHSGDPLEHETRADLAAAVEDNPGAYLSELAEATDASTSTVRYHLKVLEREAVLTPVKIRGKRRYFPADEQADELAAALADDATETVLRALASVGPASVSALAEELDRDPSTVTHHLDRLQEAGLVERERDGRSVSNSLAPAAAAALGPRAGDGTDSTAVGSSTGD